MCKIMVIPKVKNNSKAMQFMKAAVPKMSKFDNDGLGYAAMHGNGSITIERWLNPKDAFKRRNVLNSPESIALKPIVDCLKDYSADTYSKSGPDYDSSSVKSLIYHTRMATCEKNLANVHPFSREDTVLIHNGVIENPEAFPPVQSTCDSEALLNAYVELNVPNKPQAVQELSDNLQGYYAAGVFSKDSDGMIILDIIKDNRANLVVAYIQELKTEVYCTDAKILKDTCRTLGWKLGQVYELMDNVFIRYNAITGQVIDSSEFARSYATRVYNTKELRPYAADARLPDPIEDELESFDNYGFETQAYRNFYRGAK